MVYLREITLLTETFDIGYGHTQDEGIEVSSR